MKKKITADSHLLADGAWGTEFMRMGLNPGGCPEEWNITHADKVLEIGKRYADAGSDIILTNTFGANTNILHRYGLIDKITEINKAGAQISRRAAGDNVLVFGSIGPFGKIISMEEADENDVKKSIILQAQALLEGGVDGIALETMTDLSELVLAVKTVKALTGLPVVASMSYDSGPARQCTMLGVSPEEAALSCTKAGADIIGTNCGLGVDSSVRICRILRQHTALPIWVKANAGFPELIGDTVRYSMDPDGYADFIPELLKAGANIIGGCCGTHSGHIKKIRSLIRG